MAFLPPPQQKLEAVVSALVSELDAHDYESEDQCEDHGNTNCPAGCSRYQTVSWPVEDPDRQQKAYQELIKMSIDNVLPIILYSNGLSNHPGIQRNQGFLAQGWHCEPSYFMAISEDTSNPPHVRRNTLKFMRGISYSAEEREAIGTCLFSLAVSDEPNDIRLESLYTLQSIGVTSSHLQQSLRSISYPWILWHHWTPKMKTIGLQLSDFPTTFQSLCFCVLIAGGAYFGIAAVQPDETFPYIRSLSQPNTASVLTSASIGYIGFILTYYGKERKPRPRN